MTQDDAGSAPMRGSVANYPAIPNSWIPVTERLPEESEHPEGVLVWQKYDRDIYKAYDAHHVAEYRPKTGEWREFVESNLIPNVTHWMPLPAPPSDDN